MAAAKKPAKRASDASEVHLGARVKDDSSAGLGIKDPSGVLNWLAKERAIVEFADMKAIKAGQKAFADIVRQWIARVP